MMRVAKKQPLKHSVLCTKIIYKRFCYTAMQCENGNGFPRLVAETEPAFWPDSVSSCTGANQRR